MTAVPALRAVITPEELTLAIDELVERHLTLLFLQPAGLTVAVISRFSPISIVRTPALS